MQAYISVYELSFSFKRLAN